MQIKMVAFMVAHGKSFQLNIAWSTVHLTASGHDRKASLHREALLVGQYVCQSSGQERRACNANVWYRKVEGFMYRNIVLLCVFVLLCACGSAPARNQSGLFGRFPENFVDSDGFTLWMPKNMHARQGMYAYVVERQMNYCGNGDFKGGKYEEVGDVYKSFPDGSRVYAYYYYYDEDMDVGLDSIAFNLKSTQIKVYYKVIFNIIVDKNGIVTGCKCMRIRS